VTVRSRWVRQDSMNRHLDSGIKANNENMVKLEAKVRKLTERVEKLEARKWWQR